MKKTLSVLFTVFSFFVIGFAQIAFAADLDNGEKVFSATLKKDVLEANSMNSIDAITYQVKNGKNAMPAFGGRLVDEDIEDAANYVLSQSEKGW